MKNLLEIAKIQNIDGKNLKNIKELLEIDNNTHNLQNISALLAWDQEVCMPKKGIQNRAEQTALIERLAHEEQMNGFLLHNWLTSCSLIQKTK